MLLHAALCSYQRRVLGIGPQRLAEVLGAERKTIFLFLAGLLPQGGEHRESTHLGIHNPIQTVGESGEQSRVLLFYLQEENMSGIRNTDTNLRDPLLIHHTRSIIITTFILNHTLIGGSLNGWMFGWMHGWMYTWVDGWMFSAMLYVHFCNVSA